MADPPWDIHMSLPYGTMTDDEMRGMKIPMLQDEGLLFLWVTGRAMELGRDCLKAWGFVLSFHFCRALVTNHTIGITA